MGLFGFLRLLSGVQTADTIFCFMFQILGLLGSLPISMLKMTFRSKNNCECELRMLELLTLTMAIPSLLISAC